MGEKYYRFVVDGIGIYEAVDRDCPKTDSRRDEKPDGSWLEKAGKEYPGAISYWTKEGLETYIFSGLLDWHASVVKGSINVLIAENPKNIKYQDQHQIILDDFDIEIMDIIGYEDFLQGDDILPDDLQLF
ncbi:hypothetical protein KC909_00380 [Candidatus Dojkabacteria bacterium]|uniref:Uncharacterized protein n=1 Tax=Candidatus Dojkabacteria bacterium TaxID=2099670 RepID=A0A955RIX3_9BACT|nr:hypothetical protein [Candidatus Dojkabacteria bacterium]